MRVLLGLLLIAIVGCGDGSSPPGGGAVPTRGDPVSASLAEFIKGKRIHFQAPGGSESYWCDFAVNGTTRHSARPVGTFKVDELKVAVFDFEQVELFFPKANVAAGDTFEAKTIGAENVLLFEVLKVERIPDEGNRSPGSTVIRSPAPTLVDGSGSNIRHGMTIVENSIGIKLVKIPPRITGAGNDVFYMSVFEITQSEYIAVMGEFAFPFPGDSKPAHHTRWYDAEDFCRRLSDLPAEKKSRRRYRLPSGGEWIHACRAGGNTRYSFGNDESLLSKHAVYGRAIKDGPLQVGSRSPNRWGLYDMHGNVWEWCTDQRRLGPKEVAEIRRKNPGQLGRNQREVIFRRHCGGAWHSSGGVLRWNSPGGNQPHGNILDCGIRLVMEVTPPD